MRIVLFIFVLSLVGRGEAQAQWFAPWYCWVPGYEAACLVGQTQRSIYTIGRQWYPAQPVVTVQPPREPRNWWQKLALGAGPVLIGAGAGDVINGNFTRGGALVGGGVSAIAVSQPDRMPVQQAAYQSQSRPYWVNSAASPMATQPSQTSPIEVIPAKSRIPGVSFKLLNETQGTITVEVFGRRAVIAPGDMAVRLPPDIRVFAVRRDGKGSFGEVELDLVGLEDETLPGWRITPQAKPKPAP